MTYTFFYSISSESDSIRISRKGVQSVRERLGNILPLGFVLFCLFERYATAVDDVGERFIVKIELRPRDGTTQLCGR